MRFNVLKKMRLATQMYLLVALAMGIAAGLIAFSMREVKSTQGTLKFTIDNRMKSLDELRDMVDALDSSGKAAVAVSQGVKDPEVAAKELAAAIDLAKEHWDAYFLAEMIPEEQQLADATTPILDKAYSRIDQLIKKLKDREAKGLDAWASKELEPAVEAADVNLVQLGDLQMKAADLDQKAADDHYHSALKQSLLLLALGGGLAALVTFLIIRNALGGLGADPAVATGAARRIADGDLSFTIDSKRSRADSLMGALSQMKDSLLHSKLDYEGQINAIATVQGVIECKPDGEIISANEIFLKITGYTLEEVRGRNYSLFVDAGTRNGASYQAFWPALQRGESRQGEYRKIAKNGREVWVQGIYNPILDASGKPFKIVAYLNDITQQRQEGLMNAAFRGALNQLDANVMVVDNALNVILVNPAAVQMFGRSQDALRRDLTGFDAQSLMGASLESLTLQPAEMRGVVERLSDATTRDEVIGGRAMRVIMSPMKDETGRRLGTVLEWFDRTQEVATESELQSVIESVTAGNLNNRVSLEGKRNFFLNLSNGINEIVDTIGTVVEEVQGLVAAANQGDLTKRIETEGKPGLLVKIGGGINDLTENMAGLVSQVKLAASEVSRGADEISQGNANLSQRTEEQASSLEETASSMEEMTSTVKQNADNAGQASQLAVAARDQAEKGGAVVSKAVRAMTEINESSKKIADIIGVIDEIAFQTNLLALNAAVEAARAGEQGRGFAVVASEVRNLAGRSATAAKEIKALIQDSVKKVDEGSTLVTQSGSTLEQIVSSVKKVTDIVAEIAAASNEQSAGIEQVNKAVMQLDELTQQNAALVEQASAASQAMAEQARGLNESMQRYQVNGQPVARVTGTAPVHAASVPAQAGGVERRKAGRPWDSKRSATQANRTRAAAPTATAATAGGSDDGVWKEF
jgi:methyl-accepting chemotaxis protein